MIGNPGRNNPLDDPGQLGVSAEHGLAFEGSPGTKTQAAFKGDGENLALPKPSRTGRHGRSLNLPGSQPAFSGQRNSTTAARATADHGGLRKDSAGRLGDTHATSMASKQSPSDDPFKKLNSMEDYCKDQNIFFNENDRIKHQI